MFAALADEPSFAFASGLISSKPSFILKIRRGNLLMHNCFKTAFPFAFFTAATLALSPSSASAGFTFQGIGDLEGGPFASGAHGISADGSTVVGLSSAGGGSQPIYWRADTGIIGLGFLPGGGSQASVGGISGDGSAIVGYSDSDTGIHAFRWTKATGMKAIAPSATEFDIASDISTDGKYVSFWSIFPGYEALRWSASTGYTHLGFLGNDLPTSGAFAISGDGSVVVGTSTPANFPMAIQVAFRWTEDSGMASLGYLSGGIDSQALGVSADGDTVVGYSHTLAHGSPTNEAFRWTSSTGMVGLGFLPLTTSSRALDASADGSVIVGWSASASSQAFLWNSDGGLQNLQDFLVSHGTPGLTGWKLTVAAGISDDGRTIAGAGINPQGFTEGWVATIPEPTSYCLATMAAAGIGLARVLRGRRRTA